MMICPPAAMTVYPPARYVALYGTHGRGAAWAQPTSDFAMMLLRDYNLSPARPRQFLSFTGDVDGLPFISGQDWEAAESALWDYCDPIPLHDRNFIGHSHAGQFLLKAAANGLQMRSVLLVGTPVRREVEQTIGPAAVENIGTIRHLYDPGWDTWGLLGMLGDGRLSTRRAFRVPGIVSEQVKGMGHTGAMTDPKFWPEWGLRGWVDVLNGTALAMQFALDEPLGV